MVRFPRQNSLKSASDFLIGGIAQLAAGNGLKIRKVRVRIPLSLPKNFRSSQRTRLGQRNGNGVVGGRRVVDQDEHIWQSGQTGKVGFLKRSVILRVQIPPLLPFQRAIDATGSHTGFRSLVSVGSSPT